MGMEIWPVYAGESMAWLVTSMDNAPEVWTLNKVALIRSEAGALLEVRI